MGWKDPTLSERHALHTILCRLGQRPELAHDGSAGTKPSLRDYMLKQ